MKMLLNAGLSEQTTVNAAGGPVGTTASMLVLKRYEKKGVFNSDCKTCNLPKSKHTTINGALICPEYQPGCCGDFMKLCTIS
jgi:hypothetical protein